MLRGSGSHTWVSVAVGSCARDFPEERFPALAAVTQWVRLAHLGQFSAGRCTSDFLMKLHQVLPFKTPYSSDRPTRRPPAYASWVRFAHLCQFSCGEVYL